MMVWQEFLAKKDWPKYVDRIVHYGKEKDLEGIPTIRIKNGVNVPNKIVEKRSPKIPLRIIGIGNMEKWWGLDLFLDALHQYIGNNDGALIEVHLYGRGSMLSKWKLKSKELGLSEYVNWHAAVPPDCLSTLLSQAHIGIGTLAIDRKSVALSSALKHRSYAAYGFPFFYQGPDPDFEQVPWTYSYGLDLNDIINWYDNLMENSPQITQEIHRFALEKLSWEIKMEPIITFLESFNDNSENVIL